MIDGGDMIFIGGAPRSGTTLLRAVISACSDIACGPELRVIPAICSLTDNIAKSSGPILHASYGVNSRDLDAQAANLISSFLAPLKAKTGARRIAEKTPANALHFPALRRFFPQAQIISIIRDGRDVVSSLMDMDWRDDRTGEPMPITRSPHAAASVWTASVANDFNMRGDKRFYSLQYENLVRDPAREIGALFEFLNEPLPNLALFHHHAFDVLAGENEASAQRVAEAIDTSSIGRWRQDLDRSQLADVESIAKPWLERCGYA